MPSRNRTARQHNFAVIPDKTKPRSKFLMRQTRKMGFNASELVPIMCEEVLPGDTWQHTESVVARLATPIAPLIDDMDLETWYFYVPNRILTPDWEPFITGEDTDLLVPTMIPAIDGGTRPVVAGGVLDHFGILPATYPGDVFAINALPIACYFKIYNEWFRDQNLQDPWDCPLDQGTAYTNDVTLPGPVRWQQQCLRVNKRSDYFTRSLPFAQKGDAVSIPLGTTAPVTITGTGAPEFQDGVNPTNRNLIMTSSSTATTWTPTPGLTAPAVWGDDVALEGTADLNAATAATINAIRLASVTQQLLELDARGGSRYIENLLAHWSVRASNRSLQRPEYLGGSRIPITVNPIAQTAAYGAQPDPGTESPIGNLGAEMHASGHKRSFTYAAEEHGYIIGLAAVRATPTYQQGTRRHWRRRVRLDFWDPIFEGLGEQDVATQEIFQPTNNSPSNATWGFQERAAEYRYTPNEITGPLRSTATLPLDWWHLSEEFATEPALNDDFITDKTQEILDRCLAIDTSTSSQWSCQIIMDILHESVVARMMPAYSTPGIKTF